jgi:glycosyltransferase involved in cell wall biosynthesis
VTGCPVRALLINENIGGHATVHHHLRAVAARRDDVRIRIVDVPPPGFWRKVAGVAVPGLARIDADLRPVRYQLAQSAWVARRLSGWLDGELPADPDSKIDVVHLYTHNAGLLSRAQLRRVPYVVTIDSTNAQSNLLHPQREPTRFSGLSTMAVRPFERAVYANAARVVANNRWCARSLDLDYGIGSDRIELLPMGVPVPPPASRRDGAPVSDASGSGAAASGVARLPRVAFIGRTMRRKGGYDLLDVHQRWLSDLCELVLVTQDPVPPAKNVTVLDDVRPGDGRIDELLAGCAVLALPSSLDQWPNSVMEAMSHGVPPVVSDVGGMSEMVLDGQAGVVLADRSPETLRDAIAGLIDDPVRRLRLGRRARQRVVEDLDVQRTANRLLDVIRDAAVHSSGPASL